MLLSNLILFLFWSGILYFVLRYRIHIHIQYQNPKRLRLSDAPRSGRAMQNKASDVEPIRKPTPEANTVWAGMQHRDEIKRALEGLGLKARPAKLVADRVCASNDSDFDRLLRKAIQEAA